MGQDQALFHIDSLGLPTNKGSACLLWTWSGTVCCIVDRSSWAGTGAGMAVGVEGCCKGARSELMAVGVQLGTHMAGSSAQSSIKARIQVA